MGYALRWVCKRTCGIYQLAHLEPGCWKKWQQPVSRFEFGFLFLFENCDFRILSKNWTLRLAGVASFRFPITSPRISVCVALQQTGIKYPRGLMILKSDLGRHYCPRLYQPPGGCRIGPVVDPRGVLGSDRGSRPDLCDGFHLNWENLGGIFINYFHC